MKGPGSVIYPNCVDKALLSFEINCTGRNIAYSAILTIDGEPNVDRLRKAILSTARSHPELMTTLSGGLFRHHRQVHNEVIGEILEVQDLAVPRIQQDSAQEGDTGTLYERQVHEWINRPLDMRNSFPFRVLLLRKRPGESALIFTFHHSVVDGVRAVRLIDEVISSYHNRPAAEYPQRRDMRTSGKQDALLNQARSERARGPHFYRDMLSHLFHFVFINPLFHPARIYHDRTEPSGEVRFCSVRISAAELQRLKDKSNSIGGTVNDILMAVCFRTIDRWNRLHGKRTRKISLLVPIDIGTPDLNGITSNQISYISFATSAKDRADRITLLRRISAKRSRMIKERRGNTYSIVYFAYVLSHLPLAVMRTLTKYILFPLYADTVICTNPGIIRFSDSTDGPSGDGGFRIVDFEAAPFVFSIMGMTICVATFNGSLGIYIGYTTSHFSKEKVEEFLSLCLEEAASYQTGPA